MNTQLAPSPTAEHVLSKAFLKAGKALGMTQAQLGHVVGRDRTSLTRGLDTNTKSGELALMFIRCYRSLYALVGDDSEALRHWMRVYNRHTRGIPTEQVQTVTGLSSVLDYLDALRGKV